MQRMNGLWGAVSHIISISGHDQNGGGIGSAKGMRTGTPAQGPRDRLKAPVESHEQLYPQDLPPVSDRQTNTR